ncbi:hypothetical protein YC2023_037906 [Brassica napus]
MAKSKSKKKEKEKLNSQLSSPHIDIGDSGEIDCALDGFGWLYSQFSCFNVLQELDHTQVKDLKTTIYLLTPTSPELDVTKPQDMVRPGSLSLLVEAYDRCVQRKHTYEMRASSSTHVSTLGSFQSSYTFAKPHSRVHNFLIHVLFDR